ncbi:MAG: hypothetical protein WBB28_22150, partial [Crinalium sp.]
RGRGAEEAEGQRGRGAEEAEGQRGRGAEGQKKQRGRGAEGQREFKNHILYLIRLTYLFLNLLINTSENNWLIPEMKLLNIHY